MRSGSHGVCMDSRVIALLIICIAAVSVAGCTTQPAGPPIPGDTGFIAPDDSRDTGITRITGTSIIAPDYPFDNGIPRLTGTGCRMHP